VEGNSLEGLRKAAKSLSQDSWTLGQDLNLGPPEYKEGVFAIEPQHSV
jgi:hypothetical protein